MDRFLTAAKGEVHPCLNAKAVIHRCQRLKTSHEAQRVCAHKPPSLNCPGMPILIKTSMAHRCGGKVTVQVRLTPQVVKGREELLVHILLKSAQGEVPELHEGQVIVGPVNRVLQSVTYF